MSIAIDQAVQSLKTGIEFEFFNYTYRTPERLSAGLSGVIPLCTRFSPDDGEPNWGLGTDFSLFNQNDLYSSPHGLELRSPVFRVRDGKPQDNGAIARALNALQRLGCKVNHRCGIHVHISASFVFDIQAMMERFMQRKLRVANRFRAKRYCILGDSSPSRNKHHDAIALAKARLLHDSDYGEHFEVRIFNGSLNVRHAYWAMRTAINMATEEIQRTAWDSTF